MKINIKEIPQDIINQYDLVNKVYKYGYDYFKNAKESTALNRPQSLHTTNN